MTLRKADMKTLILIAGVALNLVAVKTAFFLQNGTMVAEVAMQIVLACGLVGTFILAKFAAPNLYQTSKQQWLFTIAISITTLAASIGIPRSIDRTYSNPTVGSPFYEMGMVGLFLLLLTIWLSVSATRKS